MNINSNESFGKKMRLLREEKGLSRRKVSNKSGVSEIEIYRIETDQNIPYLETRCSLAQVYDIDVSVINNFIVEGQKSQSILVEKEESVSSLSYNSPGFDYYASLILLVFISLAILTVTFFRGSLLPFGSVLLTVESMVFTVVLVFFGCKCPQGSVSTRSISLALLYCVYIFLMIPSSIYRAVAILFFMVAALVFSIIYLISEINIALNRFKS